MKNFLQSSVFACYLLASAAAATPSNSTMPLAADDIKRAVGEHIRGKIWQIEQEPQENFHVLVFVTSNLRNLEGFCFANSYVFELQKDHDTWNIANTDEGIKISSRSCAEVTAKVFADIDPNIPEALAITSLKEVEKISNGTSFVPISMETPELGGYLNRAHLDHLFAIAKHSSNTLELQFVVKGLMPQFLGIILTFESGHVVNIFVNEQNGVDVVEKKDPNNLVR